MLDVHPILRNSCDLDISLCQSLFRAAASGVAGIPGKRRARSGSGC